MRNRRQKTDDGRPKTENRRRKIIPHPSALILFLISSLILHPSSLVSARSPQPGRIVSETGSNVISGTKNFLGANLEIAPATTVSNPVPLHQVQSLISTGATTGGILTNNVNGLIDSNNTTRVAPIETRTNTWNWGAAVVAARSSAWDFVSAVVGARSNAWDAATSSSGTTNLATVLATGPNPGNMGGLIQSNGTLDNVTLNNSFITNGVVRIWLQFQDILSGSVLPLQLTNTHFTTFNGASWLTLWDSGNDGTGSGLDADLLDGLDSLQLATAAALVTATNANSILDQAYALTQASSNNVLKWFNVRNYGAQGTGTTNDFLAINSAVMAAKAASGTNRHKVYFPNGTYLLDSVTNTFFFIELANATNIDLLGESQYGTVLLVTNRALAAVSTHAPSVIHISQAKGITVENFTITGMGQETNDVTQLLTGIGFSERWLNVRIKNVLIQDISGHGVLCATTAATVSSGDNLSMENVTVNSSGNFALADGHSFAIAAANVTMLNCAASNSAYRIIEAVWSGFGTNPTRNWLIDGFTGKDAAATMVEFIGISAATNVTMQNISIVNSFFEQSRTNVTTAMVILNGYTASDRTLLDVNFSGNHLVNRGGVAGGLVARVALKNAVIANNIVDGFTSSGFQNDWSATGPNTNVQFIGNTVVNTPIGYDFYQVTNQVVGYNSASGCGTGVLVYGNSSGVQVQGGDYVRCFAPVVTASGSSSIINFGGITNNHNSSINFAATLDVNGLNVNSGTLVTKNGIIDYGQFQLNGNLIYPRLVLTASTNFTALTMVSNTWFVCDTTSGNQSNVFGSNANNAGNNLGGLGGIKWFSSTNLTGTVILDGGTTTFQFTDTGTRYLTLNCPFVVGIQVNKVAPNPRASVVGGSYWPTLTVLGNLNVGSLTLGGGTQVTASVTGAVNNASAAGVATVSAGLLTIGTSTVASVADWTSNATMTAIGGVQTNSSGQPALWVGNVGFTATVAGMGAARIRVIQFSTTTTNDYFPGQPVITGGVATNLFSIPVCTNCSYAITDVSAANVAGALGANALWTGIAGARGPTGSTGPAGSEVLPTTLLSGQTVSQTISLGRSAMYAFTNALTTNQVWSFTSATNGADVSVDVAYASTTTNTIRLLPASGMTLNLYSSTNSLSVSNLPAFFSLDVGQTNRVSFGGGVTVQ